MSRTELKILQEGEFWAAVFKPSHSHSDEAVHQHASLPETLRSVHRLDFETQGVLLLATESHWKVYHELFKSQAIQKVYLAGASAEVSPGHINGFIGARYRSSKKTRFHWAKEDFRGFHSIQEAEHDVEDAPDCKIFRGHPYQINLVTGRRHQIRSFFASLEAPLVGDELYGNTQAAPLELFAWKLMFTDPVTGKKVEIEAPPSLFNKPGAQIE